MVLTFVNLNLSFMAGSVISCLIISQDSQFFIISCLLGLINIIPSLFFVIGLHKNFNRKILMTIYYTPWVLLLITLIGFAFGFESKVSSVSSQNLILLMLCSSFFGVLTTSRTIYFLLYRSTSSITKKLF